MSARYTPHRPLTSLLSSGLTVRYRAQLHHLLVMLSIDASHYQTVGRQKGQRTPLAQLNSLEGNHKPLPWHTRAGEKLAVLEIQNSRQCRARHLTGNPHPGWSRERGGKQSDSQLGREQPREARQEVAKGKDDTDTQAKATGEGNELPCSLSFNKQIEAGNWPDLASALAITQTKTLRKYRLTASD